MKPFRREQRESRPGGTQIETGLRTEDRSCSRACAVRSWLTFLDYEPEQIVVLSHAKILSCRALSRNRILLLSRTQSSPRRRATPGKSSCAVHFIARFERRTKFSRAQFARTPR